MNFSKLFVLIALGVSLNNVAFGMQDDKKRKQDNEGIEQQNEQQKKNKQNDKKQYYDEKSKELCRAVRTNNFDKVLIERLLEGDGELCANPDGYEKNVPLFTLILFEGDLEIIKLLLEYGAHPNLQDECDSTPLSCAIERGHLKIAELLFEYGGDLHRKNKYGSGLLHLSIPTGNLDVIKLLFKRGADLTMQNHHGSTPLHLAIVYGELQVAKLLLQEMLRFFSQLKPKDKLELLCRIDTKFKSEAEAFVRYLGAIQTKLKLKIPKPVVLLILLSARNILQVFVNISNKQGKTALDLANDKYPVESVENFKKENGLNF